MRGRRAQTAFDLARRRLDRSTATVVFTARFVPFARLAVNLTAGAAHISPVRYLSAVAPAAAAWAAYQAVLGAAVGALLPGGPTLAVPVAIALALLLGLLADLIVARVRRDRRASEV